MKVFISWSGDLSRRIGAELHKWLPHVFQGIRTWYSDEDIAKGSFWSGAINDELKETGFGIVCVTPDNLASPWVMYEAGAMLGRGLKVAPFLTNIHRVNITGPLTQLQITEPSHDDVLRLLRSINDERGEARLTDAGVAAAFEKWWPDLERSIAHAIGHSRKVEAPPRRTQEEMIEEILELSRSISKSLSEADADPWRLDWSAEPGETPRRRRTNKS